MYFIVHAAFVRIKLMMMITIFTILSLILYLRLTTANQFLSSCLPVNTPPDMCAGHEY